MYKAIFALIIGLQLLLGYCGWWWTTHYVSFHKYKSMGDHMFWIGVHHNPGHKDDTQFGIGCNYNPGGMYAINIMWADYVGKRGWKFFFNWPELCLRLTVLFGVSIQLFCLGLLATGRVNEPSRAKSG